MSRARRQPLRPPCPAAAHQHDHVHAGLGQQVEPVLVVLVRADGRPAQQLLLGVLGGQGVVAVLLQVCPRNDGHQLVVFIHDGQLPWGKAGQASGPGCSGPEFGDRSLPAPGLTLLAALQDLIGFLQRDARRGHDQVLSLGHDLKGRGARGRASGDQTPQQGLPLLQRPCSLTPQTTPAREASRVCSNPEVSMRRE